MELKPGIEGVAKIYHPSENRYVDAEFKLIDYDHKNCDSFEATKGECYNMLLVEVLTKDCSFMQTYRDYDTTLREADEYRYSTFHLRPNRNYAWISYKNIKSIKPGNQRIPKKYI